MLDSAVMLEKLRDELIKNTLQIRKGEIEPAKGNAISKALNGAVQAEQIRLRLQREKEETNKRGNDECEKVSLSDSDRERLDRIANLLMSCKVKEKRGK